MTTGNTHDRRIVDLVAECLERMEQDGPAALAAICADHPDDAAAIRRRVAALVDSGFLEDDGAVDVPTELAGFRILRTLGRGGMGVVYLAEQVDLGRQVALKLVRPELLYFEGARRRFAREIEATVRLRHPSIVPVYAAGEERGVPYLAMEHVAGATLAEIAEALAGRAANHLTGLDLLAGVDTVVERRDDMPSAPRSSASASAHAPWPEAIARLGVQAADALQHAHEHGVLHRDVKPSNLMVTRAGHVMLMDFGLALADGDARLTRTGATLGSLAYMAPEQVRGAPPADARTDIYGLGVTLYELLALRPPYPVASHDHLRERILEGRPDALRTINPSISYELATVVLTAMDRDPSRRYANAAALRDDLLAAVEGRAIQASPPGPALRVRRWVQRHPARATAFALGALVAIGGPVTWALAQREANERTQLALDAERDAKLATAAALDRAQEHLADAQRAVDVISDVARHELEFVPGLGPVRTQMLEHALTFSQSIAAREGDTPEVIEATARAFFRVGLIEMELGDYEAARTPMREAAARARLLLAGDAEHVAGLEVLARATVELGSIENMIGSPETAEERRAEAAVSFERWLALTDALDARRALAGLHYRRAIFASDRGLNEQSLDATARSIFFSEQALALEPGDFDDEKQLALSLATHGNALHQLGRPDEARVALQRALALQTQLRDRRPDDHYVVHALAMTHYFLGRMYNGLRDFEPSERHFKSFFELFDELDTRTPDAPMMRAPRFAAYSDYAIMLTNRGDPAGALENFLLALGVIDAELARPEPLPRMHGDRGRVLLSLGILLRDNDQHPDALRVLTGALESQRIFLAHDPTNASARKTYANQLWTRALVQLETSEFAGCAADARRMHEHVGDDQAARRIALGLLARASQGDASQRAAWLDECFAWLDEMLAGGWSDVDDLTGNFALAGLRADPRYNAAVARLRTE